MLSNHLQNGVETAKLIWSRLPNTEDEGGEDGETDDGDGVLRSVGFDGVESLDYEVIENYAYRQEQARRGRLYVWYYVGVKWFFALLIGIGTGLAAVLINISVENFAGWKFEWTFKIIQKSYVAGFIVYTMINLALVFSSVYIVTQFAPAAAGSGIPEIKGYLNGIDTRGILLFRTLIGKISGSIGSVGGSVARKRQKGPVPRTGNAMGTETASGTCWGRFLAVSQSLGTSLTASTSQGTFLEAFLFHRIAMSLNRTMRP